MPIVGEKESISPNLSLLQLFECAVISRPNLVALIDARTNLKLTFSELDKRTSQFARYLLRTLNLSQTRKLRNPDNDLVIGVCIPPSIDLIISILSILKIRGAYLPIEVDFPTSRVKHILSESKPEILLTSGNQNAIAYLSDYDTNECSVININQIQDEVREISSDTVTVNEFKGYRAREELTAILYTSGSSGIPKGVRVLQKATLNRLVWQWRRFPYCHDEVCCFKTAITFVDSISEIYGPLLTGHSLVVVPKKMTIEVEDLVNCLEKNQIRRLVLVPSLLRSILHVCSRRKTDLPLQQLRLWVCSGEIFPIDLLRKFFDVFRNNQVRDRDKIICNFYGSTEILGDVTFIEFTDTKDVEEKLLDNKVAIGLPIANTEIYLMDQNLKKEVAEGTLGEIFVAGLNLTSGYVGEVQQEKFITNNLSKDPEYRTLYRTGDFGYFSHGNLHFGGRIDSQMKIRGHRIDLNEVQMALHSIEGVNKCHVMCYRPGQLDQALLGYFTSAAKTLEIVKSKLYLQLPRYMMPQIFKLDEIPLLVNGKVDQQSLLGSYETSKSEIIKLIDFDVSACDDESKFTVAETLLKIVAKVVGPSVSTRLSLRDNFFEIGGNSINAILAITSLEDVGLCVDIGTFIKASNLLQVLHQLSAEGDDISSSDSEDVTYLCIPLNDKHEDTVIAMVSHSFAEKGDIEIQFGVTYEHVEFTVKQMWKTFLKQGLSFVVTNNSTEDVLAVALNDDFRDLPPLIFNSDVMKHIFDFLSELEDGCSHDLPREKGKVFHSELMSTRSNTSPAENLILLQVMERENIELAKQRGYEMLFTTNTSTTTQHICEDVIGYKSVLTNQLNNYVASDKTKPFDSANDQLYATNFSKSTSRGE